MTGVIKQRLLLVKDGTQGPTWNHRVSWLSPTKRFSFQTQALKSQVFTLKWENNMHRQIASDSQVTAQLYSYIPLSYLSALRLSFVTFG